MKALARLRTGHREASATKESEAVCRECEPSLEQQARGVQQLFVRNLSGRSVTVDVDLGEDVSHLACAFRVRQGLQQAPRLSLRFTFGGRQLEPGVPLWRYGVMKGSNIHAHVCAHATAGSSSAAVKGTRHAWCEDDDSTRSSATPSLREGPLWAPPKHACDAEMKEMARDRRKVSYVEFPVTITTPFAEVDGTLEFPEQHWPSCAFSPRILRKMCCVSDVLGVHAPRGKSIMDSSWRLRLHTLHPFPGVQPSRFADIWHRLHATTARVEVWAAEGALLHDTKPLVNEDDELQLGLLDKEFVNGVQLCISLLRDAELAVDDVTVMFRETDSDASKHEVCCVCLDPMMAGDMCRRLACLHCLHAGCAMTLLPHAPCCPVCRSSIAPQVLAAPSSPAAGASARGGLRRRLLGTTPPLGFTFPTRVASLSMPRTLIKSLPRQRTALDHK